MPWMPQAALDVLHEQLRHRAAEVEALRAMVDRLTTPPAPAPTAPPPPVVVVGPTTHLPDKVRATISALAEGDLALAAQLTTWARHQHANGADADSIVAGLEAGD